MIRYVIPRGTGIIFRLNGRVPVSTWIGRYTFIAEFEDLVLAAAVCADLNRSLR
jgi:hypothetical protein